MSSRSTRRHPAPTRGLRFARFVHVGRAVSAAHRIPIDPDILTALSSALARSPLIVELRLGDRPGEPERLVFHRYELLVDYLRMVARPGDTLTAWRFDASCRPDNAVVRTNLHTAGDAAGS